MIEFYKWYDSVLRVEYIEDGEWNKITIGESEFGAAGGQYNPEPEIEDLKRACKEAWDYQQSQIELLKKENALLEECREHYAGEPFNTNDIYMDIFDLIKVKGSVTEFDSDKFAEKAIETKLKIEQLRSEKKC